MYTVRDFVNITSAPNISNIDDIVHIAKRINNTKRDYLFVNKYQGKHIPVNPKDIFSLYEKLYLEIHKKLQGVENILVISFAETATAIGEYVMHKGLESSNKLDFVYYLQTTRETFVEDIKLINFSEEHSHATNQAVFCSDELPHYDAILFIEDEITTGNTIINFINEFKKINSYADYYVASFLNWQNKVARKNFSTLGIESIYLIAGALKEELNPLSITPSYDLKPCSSSKSIICNPNMCKVFKKYKDVRLGLNKKEYLFRLHSKVEEIISELLKNLMKTNKIDVIGTEEFMYIPLVCANILADIIGEDKVTFHATTRSPITKSTEKGYIINSGFQISSAYEENRKTYLYNFPICDTVYIITDGVLYRDLYLDICTIYNKGKNNCEVRLIGV